MSAQRRKSGDELMRQRIYGEFLDMPGLRLTSAQAQRLWGLDGPTCQRLLDFLVDGKFLCRLAHGAYSRISDGLTKPLRLPA